jgi:hypothetical protein
MPPPPPPLKPGRRTGELRGEGLRAVAAAARAPAMPRPATGDGRTSSSCCWWWWSSRLLLDGGCAHPCTPSSVHCCRRPPRCHGDSGPSAGLSQAAAAAAASGGAGAGDADPAHMLASERAASRRSEMTSSLEDPGHSVGCVCEGGLFQTFDCSSQTVSAGERSSSQHAHPTHLSRRWSAIAASCCWCAPSTHPPPPSPSPPLSPLAPPLCGLRQHSSAPTLRCAASWAELTDSMRDVMVRCWASMTWCLKWRSA